MVAMALLLFLAVALTCTMFATRRAMLGFPCAIFWAIGGAQAYTLSTTPWGDWQYFLFFASTLGMTTFTMLAAFGLREKRDSIGDIEMERGDGGLIDETGEEDDMAFWSRKNRAAKNKPENESEESDRPLDDGFESTTEVSPRAKALRQRAANRRRRSTW